MQKVRLIGHESERARILTVLQDLGVLQIADLTHKKEQTLSGFRPKTPAADEIEAKLVDLRYTLDFFARYDTEKKGFIQSFFNLKELIRPEELTKIAQEYDYRPIYQQVRQLDLRSVELRSERAQLEARRTELLPWRKLPIPLEELRPTATTVPVLGRVPKEKTLELTQAIQRDLPDSATVQIAHEDEKSSYFYAFVLKDSEEHLLKILTDHGGERLSVPSSTSCGLPKAILEEIERRIREIDVCQKQITESARALLPEKPKIQALYDYFYNEHLKAQSQARLLGSPNTFILEGWIRESDVERLAGALRNTSEAVYLERINPDPDEVAPVALENRRLFKPAEFLIKLFGLPNQSELDPTPFVLPFFAIFFGIALTDAGYGLALIAIFSYLKRRYRHKRGFQPFANLIILGGISAVIAGALTGGWFGPDLAQALQTVVGRSLVLFDISTPSGLIAFLLFSFALGFIQVLLGNALEFYDKARHGRFWEALWYEGSWMTFMVGLGIVAGVGVPAIMPKELNAPGLPPTWMPVGIYLSLVGALLVLFFSRVESPERLSQQMPWLIVTAGLVLWLNSPLTVWGEVLTALGIVGTLTVAPQPGLSLGARVRSVLRRVGAGLFRLYGTTGLLGDVLSYSRIMALGVSTGLIAASMNKLSLMALGIPFVGIVVSVVFLIVLQIISLVINSLSAFVHAARLHYVEFFTKFYESGGAAFKPFTRESVYYDVHKE